MNKFHEVSEKFLKHKTETILPVRSTKGSAGYDIFLKEDITIPKATIKYVGKELSVDDNLLDTVLNIRDVITNAQDNFEVIPSQVLTWTDVCVELDEDKYLQVVVRSSIGSKLGLQLANTIGIIDSDYFENESTGGNIGICLKNLGTQDVHLKAGERIAQGKILSYHTVTDDEAEATRDGGFGSTNKIIKRDSL